MKKCLLLNIIMLCMTLCAKADHIAGGEISYVFKSKSGSLYTYSITVKMYMNCYSIRLFPPSVIVSFFDRIYNERVKDVPVLLSDVEVLQRTDIDPCINNPPDVCFKIGYYRFDVTLAADVAGYTVAAEIFYRVDNLKNLATGYHTGATYTAEIPGTRLGATAPENNSALFFVNDLAIICEGSHFTYKFNAFDADGDSLRYFLCSANAAYAPFLNEARPPEPPPYEPLPYAQDYSGSLPLGSQVHIDGYTGIISGIAPSAGNYAIAVCVQEVRNGVVIATQRKDLQVSVAACSRASASLLNKYTVCNVVPSIQLQNESTSPLIISYYWQINNMQGNIVFSSSEPVPVYTFNDTGLYRIKLSIGAGTVCADTAYATAMVYPGFKPGFTTTDLCTNHQSQFKDTTVSRYGTVNSWLWDFNVSESSADKATVQNPFFTYTTAGVKNTKLVVSDSKGCVDSIIKPVTVFLTPPMQLAFRDTLICLPDTLQLYAQGDGDFSWAPNTIIAGANTGSPLVAPQITTTYYVDMEKDQCINHDSVTVRVTDHVALQPLRDTTICLTDSLQLNMITDGLKYVWSPATAFNDNTLANPMAAPVGIATYSVIASIGKCTAQDDITVLTVPYPEAFAGNDTAICPGTSIMLSGITNGSTVAWLPVFSLNNANTLTPLAAPAVTTVYTFYAFDDKGCPKAGTDAVKITVLNALHAFAERDTAVIINQPLQLNGSGGNTYNWSPAFALSAVNISNPVAVYTTPSEGIRYRLLVSSEGSCDDSAFITVKVFKTLPSVFVPSAFSPNGDGLNDILKPLSAGIQHIDYFNVYNRWGQIIFSGKAAGQSWNGTVNGLPQPPGTYVWIVKATDYNGKPYMQKGTVTIVR